MTVPVWRYMVTDFRTGVIVREHLPLTVESFSDGITGDHTLTASIAITADTRDLNPDGATTPWQRVIWPLRDGQPQGCYVVIARPGWKAGASVLNVQASRADVIFKHRTIRDTLVFNGVDQLDIARDLLRYAMGRTMLHVATQPPSKGASAEIPWLTLDDGPMSGVLRDRLDNQDGYQATRSPRMTVAEAIDNLVGLEDGFEYRLDYHMDTTTGLPVATWRPGFPRLGAPASAPSVTFEYPGAISELTLDEDASAMANLVDVGGAGAGEGVLVGTATNPTALDQGYPLMEDAVAASATTLQATLDAKAADRLGANGRVNLRWGLKVRGDAAQRFGSYVAGDHTGIRVSDPRWRGVHEDVLRTVGWTIAPPNGAAKEQITLSVAPPVED